MIVLIFVCTYVCVCVRSNLNHDNETKTLSNSLVFQFVRSALAFCVFHLQTNGIGDYAYEPIETNSLLLHREAPEVGGGGNKDNAIEKRSGSSGNSHGRGLLNADSNALGTCGAEQSQNAPRDACNAMRVI